MGTGPRMNTIDASMRASRSRARPSPSWASAPGRSKGPRARRRSRTRWRSATGTSTPPARYGNEEHVGRGIAAAGVPRNEFFLTTKIAREDFAPDDLRRAAEDSLQKLQVEGVDLLLLHWPNPDFPLDETLARWSGCARTG